MALQFNSEAAMTGYGLSRNETTQIDHEIHIC